MGISRGDPMPHDPGCPGHSHARRGDVPCQAYLVERRRRKREGGHYQRGDCDFCTREDVLVYYHAGHPACKSCYNRWQSQGFTGNGPGPARMWAAESAMEHATLLLSRKSLVQIAAELRVTPRTITRWRAILRARIAWYLAVRAIIEGHPVTVAGQWKGRR